MSGISSHVLDTNRGLPASGVAVALDRIDEKGSVTRVGEGSTDRDGRIRQLVSENSSFAAGTYRLTFETGAYFAAQKIEAFYPQVTVIFSVNDAASHYHVPLLLSPFGYSTYRGS